MRTSLICVICGLICAICSSCIETDESWDGAWSAFMMEIPNRVSVNSKGEVAICIEDDVYITDFNGSSFTRVAENDYPRGYISWAKDGLLYEEWPDDVNVLNLYKPGEGSSVLLQEMDMIFSPIMSEYLSYVVLSEEDVFFGNINIYEQDTSRIYTLIENAYYDYEWLPDKRKIVAISVTNTNKDNFQGALLIKDLDRLEEEIIFNGTFTVGWDHLDITINNNIIFSSDSEIYLYNIDTKELSKWNGPEGYDFRLPYSPNSSLKGYVLAKVKGTEEEWGGQLYLVKPGGELIPIPGWPLWIDEPMIICWMEVDSDIIVKNLEKNETINLTEKFNEFKKD